MYTDTWDYKIHSAEHAYKFARQQQQLPAIDACADAAEFCGIHPDDFARHLIDSGIVTGRDACSLELLAADVCDMRELMR